MNLLPPIILLVRPQMGENIGAVARAMSNFGLSELRLVAPRDGWPNPRAKKTASGAESIIKEAKLYPDFPSAVADIQLAYATTARPRDMEKRVLTPQEVMEEIARYLSPSPLVGEGGVGGNSQQVQSSSMLDHPPLPNPLPQGERGLPKIALVFGPERTGLENDELTWCDALITIPTAKNASLNLAQSAVILGYEFWKASDKWQVTSDKKENDSDLNLPLTTSHLPLATLQDWQGLFNQLESYLDEINYYRVADKKTVMWQNLKTMLLRAHFSDQEVRTFRGMLRSLWERRLKNTSAE